MTCCFRRMQVTLTPHGAEVVQSALARGLGRSPDEIVERALDTIAREEPVVTEEERERRRQAVDAHARLLARSNTLGPVSGSKTSSTRAPKL